MLSSIYKNHLSLRNNKDLISKKIITNLALGHIQTTNSIVTLLLGLVPKVDSGFYYIYDLSLPKGSLVNNLINLAQVILHYTQVETILVYIIIAGRGCYLVKRDIKEAFQIMPVLVRLRYLLSFIWKGVTYIKYCLLFSLQTALFLFNLFTKGLYQILV